MPRAGCCPASCGDAVCCRSPRCARRWPAWLPLSEWKVVARVSSIQSETPCSRLLVTISAGTVFHTLRPGTRDSADRPPRTGDCLGLQTSRKECHRMLELSQKIAGEPNPVRRDEMLRSVAAGSVVSWRHINLLGEYDFSQEKLRDSFGIKSPEKHKISRESLNSVQ